MKNKKPISMLWLFGLLLSGGAQATTIDPADPNLLYTGRWERSNASRPWAYHQGSSLFAKFTGTRVTATFDAAADEWFRVILDGDAETSVKVEFSAGTSLTLAEDLAPGTHTLEIVKETDKGRATFVGLEIEDGEAVSAPPKRPTRRIVFYGDSNLAGYSLESERNRGGWNFVGCYFGYAGIASRMFGAEYQNISQSGATITSLHEAYDRLDWRTDDPIWDFSADPVDIVVVNIGANDSWRPKDQNKESYHTLLDDVRAAHPAAHIMLFNAFGWDANEPANYIHEVIAEREDAKMSSAIFPWVFARYHGCQTDHAGMAQYLASHLETITGWAADPPDVVSGYGQNGDVANGSFEDVAPFGGWGWRYFDSPGTSREFDPAGAHHGDHYLRLTNGASSHQTNPAGNGTTIALSMWLRGANEGDTVEVSISFRDQDGGGEFNEPMHQQSATMNLSPEWKLFSMKVTAPTDLPRSVFSARVTFTAGAEGSVDIDHVAIGAVTPVPRRVSGRVGFGR